MTTFTNEQKRIRRSISYLVAFLMVTTLVAGIGVLATEPANAVPTPVASYSFNENGGSTVSDLSGNGNDGTVSGASWVAGGKYGSGLSFDGSNDEVTVADDATLRIPTDITMEAWINARSVTGHRHFVGKRFYELSVDPSGGGFTTTFEFRGSSGWVAATSGQLALDQWYHVTGTFDGSVIRLYVDGAEVDTTATGGSIVQSSSPLRIGTVKSAGDFFDGLIDEVRVYDRVLTPTEIQTDMNTPIEP